MALMRCEQATQPPRVWLSRGGVQLTHALPTALFRAVKRYMSRTVAVALVACLARSMDYLEYLEGRVSREQYGRGSARTLPETGSTHLLL